MTSLFAPITQSLQKLSARERVLVGVLGILSAAAAAWYLVAQPGFSAARSAEDRLRSATSELASIRQLAADLAVQKEIAGSVDLPAALALAQELAGSHGLTVISLAEADGGLVGQLTASSSASSLAWAEAVSRQAAMRVSELSVMPGETGSLSVGVRFSRTVE